jgi:hypothetical protein
MEDVFEKFGFSWLNPAKPLIMIILGVTSIAVAVILAVSLAGASDSESTLKTSAWLIGSYDGTNGLWFGLTSVYVLDYDTIQYDTNQCNTKICTDCGTAGLVSLLTTAASLGSALILAVVSFVRIKSDGFASKLICSIAAFVGMVGLVLAVVEFQLNCADKIDQAVIDDDYDVALVYSWGPGFDCALVAIFPFSLSFILHMVTVVEDRAGAGVTGAPRNGAGMRFANEL